MSRSITVITVIGQIKTITIKYDRYDTIPWLLHDYHEYVVNWLKHKVDVKVIRVICHNYFFFYFFFCTSSFGEWRTRELIKIILCFHDSGACIRINIKCYANNYKIFGMYVWVCLFFYFGFIIISLFCTRRVRCVNNQVHCTSLM